MATPRLERRSVLSLRPAHRQSRRPWKRPVLLPLAPLIFAAIAVVAPALPPPPSDGHDVKTVRYDGVAVDVPTGWPVYDLARDPQRCVRLDQHAVYLGDPGPDQRCPAHLVGRTEAVVIAPDHGRPVTSAPAVAGDFVRVLDHGRVRVTSAFGAHPDVARTVADSVRATGATTPAPAMQPAAYSRTAPTPRLSPQSVGTFIGNAFDTCAAPSESAMRTWMSSSPYRAANIYIGGAMRACPDGNLSATWVTDVEAMGWRLIPTYVGLQAPCNSGTYSGVFSSDPATATMQGQQAADDAVVRAQSFGIAAGAPIYFDMENYSRSASGCSAAVLAFLNGWTQELHAKGWVSGAYGSAGSLITDLAAQWGTGYPEPDDLWFADWNNLDSAYGDPYVPDSEWTGHRRIHQWHGGKTETYGGVSINIDGDGTDGQVVGPPGGDCVAFPAEMYGPDGCDGAFSTTGPPQFWRFGSPYGQQHSMRWTYGNGTSESNGATWAPPHLTAGIYDLSVWVPNAHSGATAHYTVTDTDGAHSVYVDQSAQHGTWVPLGQFSTGVTGTITAHVGDDTATSSIVGVDAMTFHFLHAIDQQPPTGTITSPAAGSWARPGAPVTLAGSFSDDVYVTKVVFYVADASGNWQIAGTDTHNGNGVFRVTWPETYPDGTVVSVRADVYDTVDHVTTVTASNVLTVDAQRPWAAMHAPWRWTTTSTRQPLTWVGSDVGSGVASYDLRGQWSTAGGWRSRWHWIGHYGRTAATWGRMRTGWQYCFEVRAHDRAGNVSPWSAPKCVARALDDSTLTVAGGAWWQPHGMRRYYQSTFSSTNAANAKLTRAHTAATRVALLATTCPKCGTVRLYLGSRYVATVRLASSRWHTHQWVMSRAFAARTGTLTIRTITRGKLVRIDAVAIGR